MRNGMFSPTPCCLPGNRSGSRAGNEGAVQNRRQASVENSRKPGQRRDDTPGLPRALPCPPNQLSPAEPRGHRGPSSRARKRGGAPDLVLCNSRATNDQARQRESVLIPTDPGVRVFLMRARVLPVPPRSPFLGHPPPIFYRSHPHRAARCIQSTRLVPAHRATLRGGGGRPRVFAGAVGNYLRYARARARRRRSKKRRVSWWRRPSSCPPERTTRALQLAPPTRPRRGGTLPPPPTTRAPPCCDPAPSSSFGAPPGHIHGVWPSPSDILFQPVGRRHFLRSRSGAKYTSAFGASAAHPWARSVDDDDDAPLRPGAVGRHRHRWEVSGQGVWNDAGARGCERGSSQFNAPCNAHHNHFLCAAPEAGTAGCNCQTRSHAFGPIFLLGRCSHGLPAAFGPPAAPRPPPPPPTRPSGEGGGRVGGHARLPCIGVLVCTRPDASPERGFC